MRTTPARIVITLLLGIAIGVSGFAIISNQTVKEEFIGKGNNTNILYYNVRIDEGEYILAERSPAAGDPFVLIPKVHK
jgi:hypothetical protein